MNRAVLCHIPGTAASAATTMDGYEMTKQGRGMEAISVVTVASVTGGIIGAICLILFAPALGKISLMFSCLEYFLIACFGVLVVSGLTGDNQAKGIFSALLGLLIVCVGRIPSAVFPVLPSDSCGWRMAWIPPRF